MFGFVFGALCLYGLVKVVRGGRCGGGRWGRGGWSQYGEGRGWGWGRSPRGLLRFLFARLETSPAQERVIVEAVEEAMAAGREARGELRNTRVELAQLLRGDRFDEAVVGGMFARHDDALRGLRLALTGAFAKVHDALDPRQRAILADVLDRGPGLQGFGGPYRV